MSSHTGFYPEGQIEQVKIALSSGSLYEAALNSLELFNEHIESPVQCLPQSPVIVHGVLQGRVTPLLGRRTSDL